jgi:uncharacterized protein YkwD
MRAWRFAGIVGGFVIMLSAAGPEPKAPPNVADIAALVDAHNRERALMKLGPVKANAKLNEAALAHARDMAEHEKMTHDGSDGSTPAQRVERQGYHFRSTGENVAYGQERVDEVMRTWMDSPPHKEHILGEFTEIGGACVKSEDGTPYWCVDFGLPYATLDPAKAAAEVVAGLNEARKKAGKAPFKVHPKLASAARHHVRDIAHRDKYRLEDDDGLSPFNRIEKSGYRFRRLGEATASGQPSPEEAVRTWLEDRTNRENILGDFQDIGVGYAANDKGLPYWCLLLGKPAR